MTPTTKDMGVNPIFLDTTIMGHADTLSIYHTNDYGWLEGNPCSSDTKEELITTLPNKAINEGGEGTLSSKFLLCNKLPIETSVCQYHVRSLNSVNTKLLQDQLLKSSMDSIWYSHFPGTKSQSTTWKLLPNSLKESIELHSANHGAQEHILVDPKTFITWLPGGSAETRPAGYRRG